jgi:hypothetical protein
MHRNGTKYNDEGFNKDGFDSRGINIECLNKNGQFFYEGKRVCYREKYGRLVGKIRRRYGRYFDIYFNTPEGLKYERRLFLYQYIKEGKILMI